MSQEIQEAVYKQQEVIKDKQLSVKEDLDQVEPAVIEAQNGTVACLLISVSIVCLTDLLSCKDSFCYTLCTRINVLQ